MFICEIFLRPYVFLKEEMFLRQTKEQLPDNWISRFETIHWAATPLSREGVDAPLLHVDVHQIEISTPAMFLHTANKSHLESR